MAYCTTCGKEHDRVIYKTTRPARYCSKECIKRASYLKKNPTRQSFLRGDKGFWDTQTGIGYKWELYVADKLKGEHLPFDSDGIDVRASIGNLDVKVCERYHSQWVFNKNTPKEHIDFYYCICLEGGKIAKELLIPRESFKGRGITVGKVSAYDQFKIVG